jgi:hypothetical protein
MRRNLSAKDGIESAERTLRKKHTSGIAVTDGRESAGHAEGNGSIDLSNCVRR